jgi:sterol desaturase/sphingolipid hydroxylase (fatty acid hydroxylase superfamily)
MNPDILPSLALLAWFMALAIGETAVARASRSSPSENADARVVTNVGFTVMMVLVGASLPLTNVAAAASSQGFGIGLGSRVPVPWLAVLALTLVAQTFASYWAHRWMHSSRLLWRIHRVHHADTEVDVSTSFRNHPLELLVTVPVAALATLAIGAPLSVVTASQTIMIAAKIWEHADISLPAEIEGVLAAIIFTPRLHRLHHNPDRAVHDSNFGTLFTLWDRMFGTLCARKGRESVGLVDQIVRPDHFIDQIRSPLVGA